MDTKKLRQKILDLAIHGKLVPQDPNDEPASVLLERIRAEKEQLIKEGKIKKSKKSTKTSDTPHYEQVPFEVPEGWVWCKLEDIARIGTGATPLTKDKGYYEKGTIAWINSSATGQTIINTPSSFITERAIKETNCQVYPVGTLVIAMYGEGKTRGQISELGIEAATNQACAAVALIDNNLKEYIKAFLRQNYLHIRELAEGGNQPNLSLSKISSYDIPIPPFAEQQRIITEIDKWFTLIDIIEQGKDDLQATIAQAKSKILDLAIHGKLVPQDPSDEPAIELLRRINPKFTPCDNGQYGQLPKGWCMAQMSDLFIVNPKNKVDDAVEAGFIPMGLVGDGYSGRHSFERRPWGEIKKGYCHFTNGDIAVAKISPCFENRKSTIFEGLPNSIGAGTTELVILRGEQLFSKYFLYLFKSDWYIAQGTKYFKGVVGQQRVNREIFSTLMISVPPYAEQVRIVEQINLLFKQLDTIQSSISAQ